MTGPRRVWICATSGPGSTVYAAATKANGRVQRTYRDLMAHLVPCQECNGPAGRCEDGESLWQAYREARQ